MTGVSVEFAHPKYTVQSFGQCFPTLTPCAAHAELRANASIRSQERNNSRTSAPEDVMCCNCEMIGHFSNGCSEPRQPRGQGESGYGSRRNTSTDRHSIGRHGDKADPATAIMTHDGQSARQRGTVLNSSTVNEHRNVDAVRNASLGNRQITRMTWRRALHKEALTIAAGLKIGQRHGSSTGESPLQADPESRYDNKVRSTKTSSSGYDNKLLVCPLWLVCHSGLVCALNVAA